LGKNIRKNHDKSGENENPKQTHKQEKDRSMAQDQSEEREPLPYCTIIPLPISWRLPREGQTKIHDA